MKQATWLVIDRINQSGIFLQEKIPFRFTPLWIKVHWKRSMNIIYGEGATNSQQLSNIKEPTWLVIVLIHHKNQPIRNLRTRTIGTSSLLHITSAVCRMKFHWFFHFAFKQGDTIAYVIHTLILSDWKAFVVLSHYETYIDCWFGIHL
jgi:hypothetical protein